MAQDAQLNIYVLAADLSPRQRERVRAQLQTALRRLPRWLYAALDRRIRQLGAAALPFIVQPRPAAESRVLGLGRIDGRPAVRLMPRLLEGGEVDWGQDRHHLLAKGIGYMLAPDEGDTQFWLRWREAVSTDGLRRMARSAGEAWEDASDLSLLIEMFAAYVLSPRHVRWKQLPAARSFLDGWLGHGKPD